MRATAERLSVSPPRRRKVVGEKTEIGKGQWAGYAAKKSNRYPTGILLQREREREMEGGSGSRREGEGGRGGLGGGSGWGVPFHCPSSVTGARGGGGTDGYHPISLSLSLPLSLGCRLASHLPLINADTTLCCNSGMMTHHSGRCGQRVRQKMLTPRQKQTERFRHVRMTSQNVCQRRQPDTMWRTYETTIPKAFSYNAHTTHTLTHSLTHTLSLSRSLSRSRSRSRSLRNGDCGTATISVFYSHRDTLSRSCR